MLPEEGRGTMEQKFCPYCGKPLDPDQPCQCEGAKQAAREAAKRPVIGGGNLGLKILVVALGVVLLALMVALIVAFVWKLSNGS